jgi:glucose-1-phosphate thymidylyltransferase
MADARHRIGPLRLKGRRPVKALVLSGGHGTRLRPITFTSAKQLVPIANKPVLFYGLESLRDVGVRDVGIIVGQTGAEVRAVVGDGSAFGLNITYLQQEAPLGLAHCVVIAREFLGGDDFIMYLGDNFILEGLTDVVGQFRATRPDAQLLLTKVPNPSQFGVATLDQDGRVTDLTEKPAEPRSDLAIAGIYLFTPSVHGAVRSISPSANGELEITDALRYMLTSGADIRAAVINGYWKDTGRVEDMLECNRLVLDSIVPAVCCETDAETEIVGRVVVDASATVRRSRLVGPLIIGPGAIVSEAYVGPFTSIGPGCTVTGTEIEFSIVMAGSSLIGVPRIHKSLIGRNVEVARASTAPMAYQFVVGDQSQVRITT